MRLLLAKILDFKLPPAVLFPDSESPGGTRMSAVSWYRDMVDGINKGEELNSSLVREGEFGNFLLTIQAFTTMQML